MMVAPIDHHKKFEKYSKKTDFQETAISSSERLSTLEANAFEANEDQSDVENRKNKKQNRQMRKDYANRAYDLACGCLTFWMVMVPLSAIIRFVTGQEFLSDTALGIITTGVTINVFGALMVVVKGLFAKIE